MIGIGDRRSIQVRLEAGILQFGLEGRPDGRRPEGFESWFDAWKDREESPSPGDREVLRIEVLLYHQRASAYLMLEEYASVIRDCDRNASAIAWVRGWARNESEFLPFESIRFAVVLMRTRAEASLCLRAGDTHGAIGAIDRGLANLQSGVGSTSANAGSVEGSILWAMRDSLVPKLPSSQRVDLESRLAYAVRMENYALAAILRNELRQIGY